MTNLLKGFNVISRHLDRSFGPQLAPKNFRFFTGRQFKVRMKKDKENKTVLFRSIDFLNSQESFPYVAASLIILEFILNPLIITSISYTEIDWIAYMQEVKGFLDGEYDFANLKGDTGPLVYPAGFVYLYSALYYLTDQGTNILRAQGIFMAFYMIFIAVVLYIYKKAANIPPWFLIFVCLSRRIHSIFVLRLFNDCIAMLFLYVAIAFILNNKWSWGCFFYSVAVSIKMNIFLFAPALFLLLWKRFGFVGTVFNLSICAVVQLVLGLPFLLTYPVSYLKSSFNFGREFFYIWTVNWKFLSEEVFLSKQFSIILLVCHIAVLGYFALKKWCNYEGGLINVLRNPAKQQPSSSHIVTLLFQSNFIGFVFCRSLHFQFFVWVYHTLPYLIWLCNFPVVLKMGLLLTIEIMWNIFPSNHYSSATLFACHIIILVGLIFAKVPLPFTSQKSNLQNKKLK